MSTKKTATKKTTSKKAQASKSKKPAAKPRQKSAAKASAKPEPRPRDPNAPAVGTTLKRSFKGQDITVKVTADGFQFDGQTFSSLSSLARHITGYMISGPVFFKLVEPKAATKSEA